MRLILTWSQILHLVHPAPCWAYSAAPSADHWPLRPAVSRRKRVTTSLRSILTLLRPLNLCLSGVVGVGHQRSNLPHHWPPNSAYHMCWAALWVQTDGSAQRAAIMTACRVMRHGVSQEESWVVVVVSQRGIFLCTTTQMSVKIKDRCHTHKCRKFLVLKSSTCLLETVAAGINTDSLANSICNFPTIRLLYRRRTGTILG